MSRIRSRGNKDTEGALVVILRAAGITGWNRHVEVRVKQVPAKGRGTKYEVRKKGDLGKGQLKSLTRRTSDLSPRPFRVRPDFVWRRERVAVFVDGCFWHGCPWHGTKPSSNKSFWREKLARNRARDRLVTRTLRQAGWQVLRIWEHTLPRAAREAQVLGKLLERIRKGIDANCANFR